MGRVEGRDKGCYGIIKRDDICIYGENCKFGIVIDKDSEFRS